MRLTVGAALVFYAVTLRLFLDSRRRYPRFDKVLLASTALGILAIPSLALVDALLPLASVFVETVIFAQFALIAFGGILLGLRDRLPGTALFLLGSAILLLLAFLQGLHASSAHPLAPWLVMQAMSIFLAIDGVVFAAALVRRALSIRAQLDGEQAAKLTALADRARLSDQLDEARRDYEYAARLAEQRRRDLATASHDLKQPLLSLQMALARIEGAERVVEGVSYIEQVLQRNLDQTRPESAAGAGARMPSGAPSDGFALGRAVDNAVLMFEEEAASAGIELVSVRSSARAQAEPIVLMRILTNLIANAIHHSGGSRILVGVRREGQGLALLVADNGRGIAPNRLEAIFAPYVSGEDSTGEGLGLSAVLELAAEQGWTVTPANLPGGGVVFRIGNIAAVAERSPAPA